MVSMLRWMKVKFEVSWKNIRFYYVDGTYYYLYVNPFQLIYFQSNFAYAIAKNSQQVLYADPVFLYYLIASRKKCTIPKNEREIKKE